MEEEDKEEEEEVEEVEEVGDVEEAAAEGMGKEDFDKLE